MARALLISLLLLLSLLTLPSVAHDAKDPVCRMSTDTDTTPYQEIVGGKTYYFCSAGCLSRFEKAPAAYLTLAQRLRTGRNTYGLTLETPRRAVAGQPTALIFSIHELPSGRRVREFETVHEKPLHLLLVSADFRWFEHQHPALGSDGRFRLTWTFPRAGRYLLFTDCTPADGDNQILRATLAIGGPGKRFALHPALPQTKKVNRGLGAVVGETRVTLRCLPKALRANRQLTLTYTLTGRAGRPRTDFQPILGVMGHLIALREDGKTIVHTHALQGVQAGSYGAAMLAMRQAGQPEVVPITADMVTAHGPCFSFKLTLPKPGRYKLWAQFQRRNQWLTVPFTLEIEP